MQLEVSTLIQRHVATVWDFYAVNHVENHPRWDPSVELEATSEGPLGVGSVIKRRVNRFDRITEGTTEVLELQSEKIMRVRSQDGPMTINGWALFEVMADDVTRLTIGGEFPGMDEAMRERIRPLMERSAANIKSLIESER